MMTPSIRPFLLLASLLASTLPAHADWLNFRGTDGTAPSGPSPGAAVKWKAALPGRGLGSPVIIGDRVFISASSGPQQRRLHVICFSASTGKKQWERVLQATGRTMCHEKTAVAAPSMASDGERVFALYSSNDLFAFDLEGNLLWLRGLTLDYANASNSLGMASSPVVINGVLVVPSENDSESFTAGIDVRTGRNIWKLDRPKMANWTSPIAHRGAALLQSGEGLKAVDPATGSTLWEYADGAATVPSSAVGGDVVYVPSNGLTALRPQAGKQAPDQQWRVEQIKPGTGSPLALGGKVYAINNAGVLNQADPADGERGFACGSKDRLAAPQSVRANSSMLSTKRASCKSSIPPAKKEPWLSCLNSARPCSAPRRCRTARSSFAATRRCGASSKTAASVLKRIAVTE